MSGIKKWFKNLSGATKFMIVLCCFFTIINISVIIWGTIKNKEAVEFVDNFFDSDKRGLFLFIGAGDMFEGLKGFLKSILFILINSAGVLISYYVGKFFDCFKSIAEFFIRIKDDGWGYFFILVYNIISMLFDTYTIISFVM